MKRSRVFSGKKYSCEDFKNLAISLLEKAAEFGAQPVQKDPTSEILVCEQGILSEERDEGREAIGLAFRRAIQHQGDIRKLIEAVRREAEYRITATALLLKKLGEFEYVVKLFDKFFFANTDFELWSWNIGKYRCFLVADTCDPYPPLVRFYELSREEALLLLL